MNNDLSDAEALTAGQYVRCATCGQWVGPGDLHRLMIEDAVRCWPVIEALDVRATLTVTEDRPYRPTASSTGREFARRRVPYVQDLCNFSASRLASRQEGLTIRGWQAIIGQAQPGNAFGMREACVFRHRMASRRVKRCPNGI
jgi:hypothetical protein